MSRYHLKHDLTIDQFYEDLVKIAVAGGAKEAAVREKIRDCISRHMLQADICGIFSNCDDVKFFDPFVKIPE
ncbi:MAG: hypothetical protein HUU06_06615 [Planctomycetaceae bacterium]|nr:hypothetical protein [Planctomycetota bacterium]NUN52443.1 hypothetical protein [Planctomycetaceae bacterium]